MSENRRSLSTIWLVLIASFLIFCDIAITQDQVTLTQEQWETGYHAFSQIMRKRGVELFSDYDEWRKSPASQRILILMGSISAEDRSYLNSFVRSGGSALLATDADCGPLLVDRHQIRISEGGKLSASFSADRFDGVGEWPIVRRFDEEESLFDGVNRIVPNYPALLGTHPRLNTATGWKTIARYPTMNYGRNRPFIVRFVDPGGAGRLLLVPDHSIFVNGSVMIEDNLRFMLNTVDWLRDSNRTKCLFVLNQNTTTPYNVSNVSLYRPPPGPRQTRKLLEDLWNRTSTRDKLELANEALEFAEEEDLVNQIVESINPLDFMSRNRWFAVMLVVSSWFVIITFVTILVSNRKKPLDGPSADGLKPDEKKQIRKRERLERSRAATALFVHFFNRLGFSVSDPRSVDVNQLEIDGTDREKKSLIKDIKRVQTELVRSPIDYWTDARLEDVGRSIAQWSNLSETGVLRIKTSPELS